MKSKIIFNPLLWPTAFTVLSLLILISLGTWQIKRLIWNITSRFESLSIYANNKIMTFLCKTSNMKYRHIIQISIANKISI